MVWLRVMAPRNLGCDSEYPRTVDHVGASVSGQVKVFSKVRPVQWLNVSPVHDGMRNESVTHHNGTRGKGQSELAAVVATTLMKYSKPPKWCACAI